MDLNCVSEDGSVDMVMNAAAKKKCEGTSGQVVDIEFNNFTSCTLNWF